MTAPIIRRGCSPKMAVPMIIFAWLYLASTVEGTGIPLGCDGAQECCFYLPVGSSDFQDCCYRHGCCPSNCNSYTDASCCYNTSSYHLGSVVARLPECCINLVCGARLADSPPFIETSIVPVRIPPPAGHYCGTPEFGYCVQDNGIIRNEGSEWFETPCRHCRCEKGHVSCNSVKPVCPPAPELHCRAIPGNCCPTWDCTPVITGCKDERGNLHNLGDSWTDPSDPCKVWVCTLDGSVQLPSKPCLPLGSPPHYHCTVVSVDCCPTWNCQTGCVDESGRHHNIGDSWTDPAEPCLVFNCTSSGIQTSKFSCPPLTSPPHTTCKLKLENCCYFWLCDEPTGCVDASGVHHNEGEVWVDPRDPCTTNMCTSTGIHSYKKQCSPPGPKPNETCRYVIVHCCPQWNCSTTGCVDSSGHHNLGDVWTDPADPCYTLSCTPTGIQRNLSPCPELSSRPNHSCTIELQGCCYNWTCPITTGCVDASGHHNLGDVWTDPADPCYTLSCTHSGIHRSLVPCPPLSSRPSPSCTIELQGCCYNWTCHGCTDNHGLPRDIGDTWNDVGNACLTFFCTRLGVMNISKICDSLPPRPNPSCVVKEIDCCDTWDCTFSDCPDPYSFNRVCIHYHDQCFTNADCLSGSLCCLVAGCGKECIPVSNGKPGNCPPIGLLDPFSCYPPVDECQQDMDCSGTKKCCATLCGKKCSDSVY